MKMSTVGRAYFLHPWINANEPIHEGNKNEAFDTFFCLRKNKNVLMQKSKNIGSMFNVCVYVRTSAHPDTHLSLKENFTRTLSTFKCKTRVCDYNLKHTLIY